MQNKDEDGEDSRLSFQKMQERYSKWRLRHLWPSRILEYLIPFFLVVSFAPWIFTQLELYSTNAYSSRYFLSAMVQSQAAIVAIVVTLTLVAVQLTASSYSPRVTRIFRDNPDMWLLLFVYGLSISYGLLILKQIPTYGLLSKTLLFRSLESHIISAYSVGGFTFLILFPYMWNTINLLNPSTILGRLSLKITKEDLFASEDDPIQPIIDIIHGSIMRYDLETTRVGLNMMTDHVVALLATEINPDEDLQAIMNGIRELVCTPLEFAGKLALSKDDEKSASEVCKNLQKLGVSIVRKMMGLEGAATQAVASLEAVGRAAADKSLEDTVIHAIMSLEAVGQAAANKPGQGGQYLLDLESAVEQAAQSLGIVGRAAADKSLEDAAFHAVESLGALGQVAADKCFQVAATRAAMSLEAVGQAVVDKSLKDAAFRAVESLRALGYVEDYKGFEAVATHAARSLGVVGQAAAYKSLINVADNAVVSLGIVGQTAADNNNFLAVENAAKSLVYIGQAAAYNLTFCVV